MARLNFEMLSRRFVAPTRLRTASPGVFLHPSPTSPFLHLSQCGPDSGGTSGGLPGRDPQVPCGANGADKRISVKGL